MLYKKRVLLERDQLVVQFHFSLPNISQLGKNIFIFGFHIKLYIYLTKILIKL